MTIHFLLYAFLLQVIFKAFIFLIKVCQMGPELYHSGYGISLHFIDPNSIQGTLYGHRSPAKNDL